MFSLPVRILLFVITATYATYKLANGFQTGYLLLAAAVMIALGYFRYGSIRPAFFSMQRGDLEVARKHIETIKFPKLLSAESRTYLYWINGVLAAQDPSKLPYAEEQMRLAIDGAIRTSHDRCLAMATLAQMVAGNNDLERAMQILAEAEEIPHKNGASDYLNDLRTKFENDNWQGLHEDSQSL